MSSNFLDWERKFHKKTRKKKRFSIYEAIFISGIENIQPIESRELLKKQVMKAGLSEEEFIIVFDILKRKEILKYAINEPKGFYIEEKVISLIDKEYPKPIKLVQSTQIEFSGSKNKTIDSFLKEDNKVSRLYEELGITREEMLQILDRWKKNQSK